MFSQKHFAAFGTTCVYIPFKKKLIYEKLNEVYSISIINEQDVWKYLVFYPFWK